jgi:hypothetical protein
VRCGALLDTGASRVVDAALVGPEENVGRVRPPRTSLTSASGDRLAARGVATVRIREPPLGLYSRQYVRPFPNAGKLHSRRYWQRAGGRGHSIFSAA